nr:hypothetical protein CFP56_27231 [Quercus suber]
MHLSGFFSFSYLFSPVRSEIENSDMLAGTQSDIVVYCQYIPLLLRLFYLLHIVSNLKSFVLLDVSVNFTMHFSF